MSREPMSADPTGSAPRILLVEDDAAFRGSLALLARGVGYEVDEAADLEAARARLGEQPPHLVVLDLELPDGNGLDLKLESAIAPDTPFIVVSGNGDEAARTQALRRGAAEYLIKPLDPARFEAVLRAAQAGESLRAEVADLRASLREAGRFGHLVGRSAPMQKLYDHIARVAATAVPVLVLGESGAGKELVARTIHDMSPRKAGPLVEVNCGAIPDTLIESKLFGHERGAFTGAEKRHHGVFEQADGGTLFLDEIGEMPAELQVRLLRVLETSSFTRIGGNEMLHVDVRIIAATNRDPQEAIDEGRLREDLYHRLNVFPLRVPALRERREDIELLARHFLEQINAAEGSVKRIDAAAVTHLERASWTGNVRALRNAVQRAWILADQVLGAEHVLAAGEPEDVRAPEGGAAAGEDGVHIPIGTSVAEAERRLVLATLAAHDGNKRRAAEVLGISVRTLYSRLQEYGASEPSSP